MHPTRCLDTPTRILVDNGQGWRPASGAGAEWGADGVTVGLARTGRGLAITVQAATVRAVRLRWSQALSACQVLGDAWERGYGDLEWRGLVAERELPWYALIHDGTALHGIGVATGGAAFASWFIDAGGITLHLDLRCGGTPVAAAGRPIAAATVIVREGTAGEDEHAAAHDFCRVLCPAPRLPAAPVFGGNDWYYAYGRQTAAGIRRDAERLAGWSTGLSQRPWCVIDAGWEAGGAPGVIGGGRFTSVPAFGDMAELARDINARDCQPGLWLRPLLAPGDVDERLVLRRTADGPAYDPSLPEVIADVQQRVRTAVGWGYRMLKHDFSTFDMFGRWGFQMVGGVAADGWAFADRTRTGAEIVRDLYAAIRVAAGDALVLGCNTVGHLAAGLVDVQRTGDDTSGRFWERTRKMGPNTLAMRMPQHGAFFAADADCVGLTTAIPWPLNRAWLEALAHSGTALFVSADPTAIGPEQDAALRAAFAIAASAPAPSAALDWRTTTAPQQWRTASGRVSWQWDDDGASALCPP